MQTITPKPEVAKRRDSVPVFSFVDIKIFFFWCGALWNARCLFSLFLVYNGRSSVLAERKSRYIEGAKLNSKYIVFWHANAPESRVYIEADTDRAMFRFRG